jgi:hypothetical protein
LVNRAPHGATIDLPDDELAAVTAAIRRAIEDDKYPHAPRLDPLRAALARLEATAAAEETSASSKNNANKNSDAVKAAAETSASALSGGALHPKAPPPAKADKRAGR